jgi:hypothetical protein
MRIAIIQLSRGVEEKAKVATTPIKKKPRLKATAAARGRNGAKAFLKSTTLESAVFLL